MAAMSADRGGRRSFRAAADRPGGLGPLDAESGGDVHAVSVGPGLASEDAVGRLDDLDDRRVVRDQFDPDAEHVVSGGRLVAQVVAPVR